MNKSIVLGQWRIHKGPSIFTYRSGKNDIVIMKQCKTHGAVYCGIRYITIKRLKAENHQLLSGYGKVPDEIMLNIHNF